MVTQQHEKGQPLTSCGRCIRYSPMLSRNTRAASSKLHTAWSLKPNSRAAVELLLLEARSLARVVVSGTSCCRDRVRGGARLCHSSCSTPHHKQRRYQHPCRGRGRRQNKRRTQICG